VTSDSVLTAGLTFPGPFRARALARHLDVPSDQVTAFLRTLQDQGLAVSSGRRRSIPNPDPKGSSMTLYDYQMSRDLVADDPPFAALIMAALRKADTENAAKISAMWPGIAREMRVRYNAPGGLLASDGPAVSQ
jgi:predicted ArsR family transcriptional regulator